MTSARQLVPDHPASPANREMARTLAVKQAEHFFDAVLDGRSPDEVASEISAGVDAFAATLPPAEVALFKTFFAEEYDALQRRVVNDAELQAIIACGIARNDRKRRRRLIARVSLALGLAGFVVLGAAAYALLSG